MSKKKGKESPSKMSLSEECRKQADTDASSSASLNSYRSKDGDLPNFRSENKMSLKRKQADTDASSSASLNSYRSKDGDLPNFRSENKMSLKRKRSDSSQSSCVSVRSDLSKDGDIPNFSEEAHSSPKRHNPKHRDLPGIFQDLEDEIVAFLKTELKRFLSILQKDNSQYFVNDFSENKCSDKETVLDLTLSFLRKRKQDEVADSLKDELFFPYQLKSSLKKKFRCVTEGIAKQGDCTLLNNIYTDLYITQGDCEQVNTEHEVRQIEVISRRHESQEIPVKCKHLFEASEKDKQIRTVLTKGVAGIGKSFSVQKFVLDWAEGKENQDINFIFPLPFREMNLKEKKELSLMDLITQFFPEIKGLNLTRRNHFKVLFILDGVDEFYLPLNFAGFEMCCDVNALVSLDVLLMNLIKGNLLPSALIWITSRPAAASKIPPDCIDRLTEIRGFNDTYKEEYFRKKFTDQKQAMDIIDHVKKSKSLFIMCHIPVFCWISATVLQNILEEEWKNGDGASTSMQGSNFENTPKTLTQMYAHFLRFQMQQSRRKYDGENTSDVSWDIDTILSLGKLAFHHLEKSNMIFYNTDLEACGIDVHKASVYSGMCTQIFKKETGIILGPMYCFVHLSVQEFIAALYAHLFLDINKKSVFDQNKNASMIDLLKTAVDKALASDNGNLDLFLRFLLGLSLQSNHRLLQGLLTQQDNNDQIKEEIVQYIKQKFEANYSPERCINLFYCLNELNDQSLVKEIQTHLSKGSLSSVDLSPAQWSALAFVLLTSEDKMEEFELQKFKKSDECLIRLLPVIKTSKSALLNDCNLTDRSCSALATILESDTNLKELNMNNNNLQDSGVKLLCAGLKNVKCRLEILRLSSCNVTEEGYKTLASALKSNPSHLIELDLRGNDPGHSGVKVLSDLLQDPNCQLNMLRFLSPAADESCKVLTRFIGEAPLDLRELNLSGSELGDTQVKQLSDLLQDKHCQINTLLLNNNRITAEGCAALTSAFNCNPSYLIKLNLSGNNLGNSGILNICCLLKNTHCRLKKLNLTDCSITEEGYKALASALRSNPSNLIELDLRGNDPGQTGVKELSDLLQDPNCQLNTPRFLSPAAEKACNVVPQLMDKNPLHLRDLNLSRCMLKDTHVNLLSALLQDKHVQINSLILWTCGFTEKQCMILTSALKSNPSHLRELDLTGNKIKNTGVNNLCDLLKNSQCKLETLRLRICEMTDEGCSAVISALKSNPSHLRELDLSVNKLGESGVKSLKDLLINPRCKLEIIYLCHCSITENQCMILTSALKSNPSHLRELDLSENKIRNTGVNHLCDLLKDSHCKLEKLRLWKCGITDVSSLTQCLTNTTALHFLKELDLSGNSIADSKQHLAKVIQESTCELSV